MSGLFSNPDNLRFWENWFKTENDVIKTIIKSLWLIIFFFSVLFMAYYQHWRLIIAVVLFSWFISYIPTVRTNFYWRYIVSVNLLTWPIHFIGYQLTLSSEQMFPEPVTVWMNILLVVSIFTLAYYLTSMLFERAYKS